MVKLLTSRRFSRWSDFPLWLRTIAIVAALNFASFWLVAATHGGDATNGYQENGRYFVAQHGQHTEVSRAFWIYSYYHGLSIWVTHATVFIALAVYLRRANSRETI